MSLAKIISQKILISMNLFLEIFVCRLFSFKGRASRREYIIRFFTMLVLCWINIYTMDYISHNYSWFMCIYDVFLVVILVIYLIQMFPLTHRRLHDLNASGWWQLITFIPCGQILMIGFIFFKGTQGPNKYGEEPKYWETIQLWKKKP